MVEHITQEFLTMIKCPNPNVKRLNYLLVMPRIAESPDIMYVMPYGFCLVTASLKASGRNVFTLNLNYKEDPYMLLRKTIIENDIDIVATGGLSGQFSRLKAIVDTAKSVSPSIITMVGGGIITADPAAAMKALEADYGMIGEGEITINELAYALENGEDVHNVAGIVLPDGFITKKRPEILDLDILPFPDYEGLELELVLRDTLYTQSWFEKSAVGIALSRSCPYNCTFCFHSSGKRYRKRSLDNVFSEIKWIINKWGVKYLIINDELFVSNKSYLVEFCNRIKYYHINYWIQTRVDTITKEILLLLKESGCSVVSYGVESADNRILKSMQKNITVEQIERAFDLALEVGIPAYGNIILGDLEETQETIQNSLYWWRAHPKYHIYLIYILTFPGTYLYQVACERGLIKDRVQYLVENKTQINLTKMSDQEYWDTVRKVELFQLLCLSNVEIEWDHIDAQINILAENLEKIGDRKIAIWPALFSTISLLSTISRKFIDAENVYFINSAPGDTRLQGIEQFGKNVFEPDILEKEGIDTVLFAFTQRGGSERVYQRILTAIREQHPGVKYVVNLPELLNTKFTIFDSLLGAVNP